MDNFITSIHGIEESLKKNTKAAVLYISKSNKRIDQLEQSARKVGVTVQKIDNKELDRMCAKGENKGVALKVQITQSVSEVRYQDIKNFIRHNEHKDQLLVLVLDGITDPHNFGAILRSADQFGVDLVVTAEKRSASINATVAKVSVGAHAWVPTLQVTNLVRTLEELQKSGFWIYGADMGGGTAPETDLKGKTVLVMGSEGAGISRLVREKCDTMVSIPTSGHVDSLNVSVAAGILMYEVVRQRG
ncbi:MAG: 23S rRNA (guanosine(2251)-2'-O)-methyltransferase RlmB [Spirochaetaceae bacterium 4572_59]|nr:MAG: 23S rRNA (guanosine(2251)-2'-O)-methyltransferase RlmB [Spirochaetaceae bacterium 4572_59]